MPSETLPDDSLNDPVDDDVTVAREPRGPVAPNEAPPESHEARPIDVDLAVGSSIVVPVGGSSVLASRRGTYLASKPTDSASGTAYFMKPMPQRHGGLVAPAPNLPSLNAASQLWQTLTVELDQADGSPGSTMDAPVRLEHFEIGRMIGRGGMGAVFSARDTRLNRLVALKVLSPDHTSSRGSMDRFRNEARAAARLDHENIARVHYIGGQFGSEDSAGPVLPFIAFEFIEGTNIRELIRQRGPLSVEETIRYGLQLTHALRHTNSLGIVHRDIKPSNVIVTPQGRAKLVDLGLARTDDPDTSHELTVAGTTLGTFDYISPEQAKDPRSVDIRSDIYSLGCTMFHMAIGKPPYPEGTMLQKLLDHQDRVVPDAAAVDRRIPPQLSDLIKRMMDSQPEERPQTPEALLVELTAVANELGIRPGNNDGLVYTTVRQHGNQGWRDHLGWLIAAGVLGVIAIFTDQVSVSPPVVARTSTVSTGTNETPGTDPSPSGSVVEETSPVTADVEPGDVKPFEPREPDTLVLDTPTDAPPPSGPIKRGPMTASETPVPKIDEPIDVMPVRDPKVATTAIDSTISQFPFSVVFDGEASLHTTLEEAVSAAPSGAVIKIRQGGLIARSQRPVRLDGKSITIQPDDRLEERPLLRLAAPTAVSSVAASISDIRLFKVSDGASLKLYDLDFEVIVTREAAGKRWSVFSTQEGASVSADGVSFTVRNPNNASLSLFDVDFDQVSGMDDPPTRVDISLNSALVRGDASLIRWDGRSPVQVDIDGTAIATSGPLLGVDPVGMPLPNVPGNEMSLNVRQSTWVGESQLIQLDAEMNDRIALINVVSDDSVFSLLNRNQPLVLMTGQWVREEFESLLLWTGANNYYAADIAWQIESADEPEPGWTFDMWKIRFGLALENEQTVLEAVNGEQNRDTKPLTEFTAIDFAPIASSDNPIPTGGAGGRPAGVDWNRPDFPTPVSSNAN